MAIGFLFELYQGYLSSIGAPTYVLANLFTLTETLFLFYFFSRVISSANSQRILLIAGIFYAIAWTFLFVSTRFKDSLELSYGLECICIIALSIYYFFEQIKKPDSLYIYSQSRFWVVSAYLIYTAGTFFLFLFQKDLSIEEQQKYFILNSIFLILKTLILSIAMLMKTESTERKKFQLT